SRTGSFPRGSRRGTPASRWMPGSGSRGRRQRPRPRTSAPGRPGARTRPPPPGSAYYRAFTETSYANGYVFDSALEIVAKERLGQDGVPDILAISLSTNDYVGDRRSAEH